MAGKGIALVEPRSRLSKATMPTAKNAAATMAMATREGQSYWPASGKWPGRPVEP